MAAEGVIGAGPEAVLIAGPTASGKSALALGLAARLGGEIINVDAMQLYADLRILTARPSPEEEARVPHALYGVLDAAVRASAGMYLELARKAVAEARARGRLPVLVGGTGLYFHVLLNGIAAVPPVPEEIRRRVARRLETEGTHALHAVLAARDPETAAGIRPSDSQRIARALGVLEATGEGLAVHQARERLSAVLSGVVEKFVRAPPRDLLYSSVDRRFDAMLSHGALEEVVALKARALDPTLPLMRAHGAPELMAVLEGRMTLDGATARAKLNTRRYVKRQLTWARHRMADWIWLGDESGADALAHILTRIRDSFRNSGQALPSS